jgi:3-isopropylmalate/(R)-2-methylmalate dehydratase large subunit
MTLAEKLLAKASGQTQIQAGDIIWANVDAAMMDDVLGPRIEIAEKLEKLKAKIWDRDKVVLILDHYTPPANAQQADILKFTRDWAQQQNICWYEGEGPCHQIMAEKGYDLPGSLVVGTDSHTCMAGAFGSFGTGIGSTEMIGVLATGQIWLRVPKTINAQWQGILGTGVYAKDMALRTVQDIGHAGATYMALEFTGDTVYGLPMDERMCLTNMAVETGAKVGLIAPDDVVQRWLKERQIEGGVYLTGDADAAYLQTRTYNAAELEPLVACPHSVDNVDVVRNHTHIRIDQAYLGSCTGGRYTDLVAAEKVIRGRKIPANVRFLVSPASNEVYKRALEDGLLLSFVEAGARVLPPTCGICGGLHSGALAAGENCLTSTNRNFLGRMGSKESNIYLGSAATVAASAITGHLTDPREFFN